MALYDLILTTLLLYVLIRFLRSPRATGSAIALFTLWYAGGRILTDFLRTDPRRLLGLTGSQLTAVAAVAAFALFLWRRSRRQPRGHRSTIARYPRPRTGSSRHRSNPDRERATRSSPSV